MRQFCQRIGLSTHNYVQRIVSGQRNLTVALAERFIPVLGLRGADATYFRALVALTHARSDNERDHYLRLTSQMRTKNQVVPRVDNTLLRQWYLSVIWEMAACRDITMTPPAVAQALGGKITPSMAADALDFLVRGGYLEALQDGRFRKLAVPIHTSDGRPDPFVRLNHSQMLDAAKASLALPIDRRIFYGMALAVKSQRLPEIQQKLRTFFISLSEDIDADDEPDTVYRFGLHCFPLTDGRTCR